MTQVRDAVKKDIDGVSQVILIRRTANHKFAVSTKLSCIQKILGRT